MKPQTVFTLNSVFGAQFRGKFFCKEKGKEPESTMETGICFLLYDIKISEIKKVIVSLILVFTLKKNKFVQIELPTKE